MVLEAFYLLWAFWKIRNNNNNNKVGEKITIAGKWEVSDMSYVVTSLFLSLHFYWRTKKLGVNYSKNNILETKNTALQDSDQIIWMSSIWANKMMDVVLIETFTIWPYGVFNLPDIENLSYIHSVFTWSGGLAFQRSNLGKRDGRKSI